MRLVLKLSAQSNSSLSLNYHYALSAVIYNLLRFGSPEFSEFLHDIGYQTNGKKYKLFCFALKFEHITIQDGRIKLLKPGSSLYITSPLVDDFLKNFIIGSFEEQSININDKGISTEFSIQQIEYVPEITYSSEMKFISLSPIVLSTRRDYKGKEQQYFLRPDDSKDINRILTQNLKNKFSALNNQEMDSGDLELNWEEEYLQKHKRVTKKITINQNGRFPIDVIGIQAPFTLKGDPELIKIGYECGFGEKNSMGFGMAHHVY